MSDELTEVENYIRATIAEYKREVARIEGQLIGLNDALSKVVIILKRRKTDDES